MKLSEKQVFSLVKERCYKSQQPFIVINGALFLDVLRTFPPKLDQKTAKVDLRSIYRVVYHKPSNSLIIHNLGVWLNSKSPKQELDYRVKHIGLLVYNPRHGSEIVDIGITGDCSNAKHAVVRPESACSPSFILGSQRCNCLDQWQISQELAAMLSKDASYCFVSVHMGSQNGMGSGADNNQFSPDITETAHMRHRGEYSVEVKYGKSMSGGFSQLGLTPDPRKLNNSFAYQIPTILTKYLIGNKELVLLTNNNYKVSAYKKYGFDIKRIRILGRIDKNDMGETIDRKTEFKHKIGIIKTTNFSQDLKRIYNEIRKVTSKK